ncbi:MAG: hypothetical protein J0H49_35710 [Acidobacteria bacterium]|nr:hypothetical protein [Acidobacteriota bacterium]
MARNTPWIILLCKFSDDPGTTALRPISDYVSFFAGNGPESMPSYWRDMSYGELDLVTGTEVTPWLQLPQKRSDHTGLNTRGDLFRWAKEAGERFGVDFGRFFGAVAFFAVPTDLFGTASEPHVVCDVLSCPAQIVQEYGHAYGLDHSSSVRNPVDYENPVCSMSSMTFGGDDEIFRQVNPTFATTWGPAGPGLCSPYIRKLGWLTGARSVEVRSNGRYPTTTTLTLSPLGDRNPPHPQVAVIEFDKPKRGTCCIEYRRGGWDRGIFYNPIVIHEVREDERAYYAGMIRPAKANVPPGGVLPSVPAGKWYVDPQYDFSLEVQAASGDGASVTLRVAPAAAAGTLSLRSIAAAKLNLSGQYSVRSQVLAGGNGSLRGRLVELLGQ